MQLHVLASAIFLVAVKSLPRTDSASHHMPTSPDLDRSEHTVMLRDRIEIGGGEDDEFDDDEFDDDDEEEVEEEMVWRTGPRSLIAAESAWNCSFVGASWISFPSR